MDRIVLEDDSEPASASLRATREPFPGRSAVAGRDGWLESDLELWVKSRRPDVVAPMQPRAPRFTPRSLSVTPLRAGGKNQRGRRKAPPLLM